MARFLPSEKMFLYLIRSIAVEKGIGTWEHSHRLYERRTGQRGRTQDSLKNQWKKLDHDRAEIGLDPEEYHWQQTKKELTQELELEALGDAGGMYRRPSAADTATQRSASFAADTQHAVESSCVAESLASTALSVDNIDPRLLETTDTAVPATVDSAMEHPPPLTADGQTTMCDYSASDMAAVYNTALPVHHACALGQAADARPSTLPSGMMSVDKGCTAPQPYHGLVSSVCGRWTHDHPAAWHRPTCCAFGAWPPTARRMGQGVLGFEQICRGAPSGVLDGMAAYGFGSAYSTDMDETVDYASDTSTLNDSALYAFADDVGSLPAATVMDDCAVAEPGK